MSWRLINNWLRGNNPRKSCGDSERPIQESGRGWAALAAVLALLASSPRADFRLQGDRRPAVRPDAEAKCPVCGMFVAKYPDFLAEIVFDDGTAEFFDGARDMFGFYFEMERYRPGRKPGEIQAIYVTDYYDLDLIDGFDAYFVVGSDIFGPMGAELIPLKTLEDALTFLADHAGEKILRFREVTLELVKGLG